MAESVVVIGAGIVGMATALRLLERGFEVTVVDHQPPGEGASYGNAGVLATGSIMPVTVPGLIRKIPGLLADPLGPVYAPPAYLPRIVPWMLRYLRGCSRERCARTAKAMAAVTADSLDEHRSLTRGTPAEARIREIPYAFVYRDRAQFDAESFGWGLRGECSIPWEVLEGDAVREAEPELSARYQCLVVLSHQHGIIDGPGAYVKDLAEMFLARGGRLRLAKVTALLTRGASIIGARCEDGTRIECKKLVVTAGAWSARLLKTAGIDVPLEAERGYHVELFDCSVSPNHALSLVEGKFVATPMAGRLRLAGLSEFGGLDAPARPGPVRTLLTRVRHMFPDIRYGHHREWLGHRPAVVDSLPVIGGCDALRGLYLGFGHQHVGLTGGPRTGRMLADLVAQQRPNVDLSAYAVERFAR